MREAACNDENGRIASSCASLAIRAGGQADDEDTESEECLFRYGGSEQTAVFDLTGLAEELAKFPELQRFWRNSPRPRPPETPRAQQIPVPSSRSRDERRRYLARRE